MTNHAVPEKKEGQGERPDFAEYVDSTRNLASLYSPLHPSEKQIRLLQLQASRDGTFKDTIECIMITAPLSTPHQCVSYAWGSTDDPREILVNGHVLRVTRNLHRLLRRFRHKPKFWKTSLWIDAICINQQDLEERAAQVRIMGEIYSGCEGVHIWLGKSTDATAKLFELIRRVPVYLNAKGSDLAPIVDDEEMWAEFCRIVDLEWFTRLWVIQEAILSKIRLAWTGDCFILLESLLNAGFALVEVVNNGLQGIQHRVLLGGAWELAGLWSSFDAAAYPTKNIKSVLEGLPHGSRKTCTDPRDRVYGLLSLLPTTFRPTVDYTLSTAEVYTACTAELMEWSKTLEPLRLKMPREDDLELPSWALDFRNLAPYHNTSEEVESDFEASANATCVCVRKQQGELHVRGLVVSTIVACHPFELIGGDDLTVLDKRRYDDNQLMRTILSSWRDMAVKHAISSANAAGFETDLWATIATDKLPASPSTKRRDWRHMDAGMARDFSEWLDAEAGDPKAVLHARLLGLLLSRVVAHTFFVTTDGRMGSVIGDCKIGDSVVVLAGLSRAALMRRPEKGTFHGPRWNFAGVCYCNGLMNGDFIRERASDEKSIDDVFDQVILV